MWRMAETIQEMLRHDKDRRGWSFNTAAPELSATSQSIQRWMTGEDIPNRKRAPQLARFLDRTEQEVRSAMEESENQREAARTLQAQIDAMRADQKATNKRLDDLLKQFQEILRRLPE